MVPSRGLSPFTTQCGSRNKVVCPFKKPYIHPNSPNRSRMYYSHVQNGFQSKTAIHNVQTNETIVRDATDSGHARKNRPPSRPKHLLKLKRLPRVCCGRRAERESASQILQPITSRCDPRLRRWQRDRRRIDPYFFFALPPLRPALRERA
jgi:hypothetical protein